LDFDEGGVRPTTAEQEPGSDDTTSSEAFYGYPHHEIYRSIVAHALSVIKISLFAGLLLENKLQFQGREIPDKDGRRFNQMTVAWARRKRTGCI
jgi:hypothetical protein